MRLFVLGATGGTGLSLLDQAAARGHRVTAFVRSPHKVGAPPEGVTVLRGDPLDAAGLGEAMAGHDAVLSSLGAPGPGPTTIVGDGARSTVAAMRAAGVGRLLIVSAAALFDAGLLFTILRNTLLRNLAKDFITMERVVAESGLDWTIARPPYLTNGPLTASYGAADGRMPPGSRNYVSRADVAHFLLEELESPAHLRQIVGVALMKGAAGRGHVAAGQVA